MEVRLPGLHILPVWIPMNVICKDAWKEAFMSWKIMIVTIWLSVAANIRNCCRQLVTVRDSVQCWCETLYSEGRSTLQVNGVHSVHWQVPHYMNRIYCEETIENYYKEHYLLSFFLPWIANMDMKWHVILKRYVSIL